MSENKALPLALCLGGVDPSGGAGLYRDIFTLAAFSVGAMAVSTAETVQNGASCLEIHPPAIDPVRRVEALKGHLSGQWGVKLGLCAMLPAHLNELMILLDGMNPCCGIWDPILAPTIGEGLHSSSALAGLASVVLKTGRWVVSPNLLEAQALLGESSADPRCLAKPWLDLGARAVWLKGGHSEGGDLEDFWITDQAITSLGRNRRLMGERRGTGCTVASAWLAQRLSGADDITAARNAVEWIRHLWDHAWSPGNFGRAAFHVGNPC